MSDAEQIEFRGDDDALQRARNIWRSLGFVNDRFGATERMAWWLEWYRQCDVAAEREMCAKRGETTPAGATIDTKESTGSTTQEEGK